MPQTVHCLFGEIHVKEMKRWMAEERKPWTVQSQIVAHNQKAADDSPARISGIVMSEGSLVPDQLHYSLV